MKPDTNLGGKLATREVFNGRPRRSFSTEFKQEAASLVLDQGYSVPQASRSLDIGETALRRWVDQLRAEDGNPKKDKGFSKPNSEAGPKYSYGT